MDDENDAVIVGENIDHRPEGVICRINCLNNTDAGSPHGDGQSPTPVVGSNFGHEATFKLPLQSEFSPYEPTIVIGGKSLNGVHL